MSKKLTNQQMVKNWLKERERNYSYIARHTGIYNSILSLFRKGKPVSNEIIVRLAEFTGLPLRMEFKGCKTKLTLKENKLMLF